MQGEGAAHNSMCGIVGGALRNFGTSVILGKSPYLFLMSVLRGAYNNGMYDFTGPILDETCGLGVLEDGTCLGTIVAIEGGESIIESLFESTEGSLLKDAGIGSAVGAMVYATIKTTDAYFSSSLKEGLKAIPSYFVSYEKDKDDL
jgi:hypothetical protein